MRLASCSPAGRWGGKDRGYRNHTKTKTAVPASLLAWSRSIMPGYKAVCVKHGLHSRKWFAHAQTQPDRRPEAYLLQCKDFSLSFLLLCWVLCACLCLPSFLHIHYHKVKPTSKICPAGNPAEADWKCSIVARSECCRPEDCLPNLGLVPSLWNSLSLPTSVSELPSGD